jgi:S-formylglutathione hydrolase FrmB
MASGTWSEQTLHGHLVDVFTPSKVNEIGYVVLYLHGVHLHRLTDNAVFTELFERHGLPVVAPMTQRSWWVDRICEEFDAQITAERFVLDHVLPLIAEQFGTKPPRIGLLGTSMGGQGALRFAFKHPQLFPVAAAIAPAIDFHIRLREGDENLATMYRDVEQARQDTALLHVHPLNWPRQVWFSCDPEDHRWWDSSDRLHMKLASMGIPHECDLRTTAGGHGAPYYHHMAPAAVEFLLRGLEKERRRIV